MATNLKILGWSAKGLRCPNHNISFEKSSDNVHKISLLQMPNGTGKTTTLRLLRAALTGPDVWNDDFEKVNQFRKNNEIDSGQFELRLLHNDRRLTIQMQLDFETNEVKYITTSTSGKENGFLPPIDLKPFLSKEFVELLVFDGELAAQLLDSKHTNAQRAIEEMYQLSFFPAMQRRIDEYWKELAQDSGSSGGTKELTRRSGRVTALKDRYKYVKESHKKDLDKLNKIKNTLKTLDKDFRQQIEKNKQDARELAEAEATLTLAKQALAIKARDLALLMKNPLEFSSQIANSVYSLKENLDRAKLPGIAAREFFDEIADEPHCICGREIDAAIKEAIKSGAKKYLGSEEMNVLNVMKTAIRDKFPDAIIVSGELVKEGIKEIEEAQDKEALANQNLDTIKLLAGTKNPEIEKIQKTMSELSKAEGELEKEMSKYEDRIDSDDSWNLDILAKRTTKAEDDLADTTGTLDQKKKRDILHTILDKAFQKSRTLLSESICEQANKKIAVLMPDNNIKIDAIDRSLRLAGKEGGSVGETLSVGYAFLSSLLSNTEHSLPSVVDSPSGSIDLQIRPEIGRIIPKLADQFIAFTISSERQNFVEPLLKEANGEVHFLTLFKRGNKQLENAAKQTGKATESEDGIWVTDKNYFEHFHTETE